MKKFASLVFFLFLPFSVWADLLSTTYTEPIDLFETGSLGSQWTVTAGNPADVAVVPSLSAYYDGGYGPDSFFPPQGSGMLLIDGRDHLTQVSVDFMAYVGEKLNLDWFFATGDTSRYPPSIDDVAGVSINGSPIEFITSITTGNGDGYEVSNWRGFVYPLQAGMTRLDIWVENPGFPTDSSQFAIDRITVSGVGANPRLSGNAVPEPGMLALLGIGMLAFSLRRRA